MILSESDWQAIVLTLKLAFTVTLLLMIVGTPLALWLAHTRSKWKGIVNALVAMPLVLPPTVIGFYLLMLMGPQGWIGQMTQALGLGTLVFTFWGLVVASMVYSLPFVVQPIQNAIESLGHKSLEAAATLGASPIDRFFSIILPSAKPGFISAFVLGFAHTVGEFGVVLMLGGNIPGETRVVSVQIYDHVEALEYSQAHSLSLVMVLFSFFALMALFHLQGKSSLFNKSTSR